MVRRMTAAQAVRSLRACLDAGRVNFTNHAIEEAAADKLSLIDLYTVLKSGNIFKSPEEDIKTGEWKYRVEGRADGRLVVIIFKFKVIDHVVVITVFEIK